MEKQVTKDGSGSDTESEKEPEPWRCEENRARYERNKRELILTESEQEYYEAQVKEATEDLLSYIREKHKRLDAEAEAAKTKSKSQ